MIRAVITLVASPEKQVEVIQTLVALSELIRKEDGCLECGCWRRLDESSDLEVIEEWVSSKSLDAHFRSRSFGVLNGLTPLLLAPVKVSISNVSSSEVVSAEQVRRRRLDPE